jgi:hypothetical protein
MFSLHETSKRMICRAAFVVLCLGPTVAVLGSAALVRHSSFTRRHERAISAQLGLAARISRASTPRPGITLYEGLELADPETLQPLARLPFVEVEGNEAARVVRLPHPGVLNGARLDRLWRLARQSLALQSPNTILRLAAQNLTIHLPAGDQSVTDVNAEVNSAEAEARLTASFRHVSSDPATSQAAVLTLVCPRPSPHAASAIEFSTGSDFLPCAMAAGVWPAITNLGSASEFHGRISGFIEDNTWRMRTMGELKRIDLGLLVSSRFPHQLSGEAQLSLDHLILENGRLASAAGTLSAGPGRIGSALIAAAQQHLRFAPGENLPEQQASDLGYAKLKAAFAINSQGLMVRGEVPGNAGALLVGQRQAELLREPTVLVQPAVNLVRALVPQSEVQVPATRETSALVNALPVPSIMPAANGKETSEARSLRVGKMRR